MSMPSQPTVAPPPKKSGGGKFLMGCGGIFLILCLLCCGVGGYLVYSIKSAFVTDPAKVREIAHSIADADETELTASEPLGGFDGNIPTKGKIRGAMFTPKGGMNNQKPSFYVIAEFPSGESPEDAQKEIQGQAGGSKNNNITFTQVKEVQHQVNGKPGTFKFMEGKDDKGNVVAQQVIGIFAGKEGAMGIIVIMAEPDDEDTKEIENFIDSIK